MKRSLERHSVVTLRPAIHTEGMGKVIRFPLARRLADVGRGARVFESLREQERASSSAQRAAAQAVSISVALVAVLQALSLTA